MHHSRKHPKLYTNKTLVRNAFSRKCLVHRLEQFWDILKPEVFASSLLPNTANP